MASPTLTIPGKFLRQLATKQGVVCLCVKLTTHHINQMQKRVLTRRLFLSFETRMHISLYHYI